MVGADVDGRSSTRASPGGDESCISDTYAVPPANASPAATNATVGPSDITEDPPSNLPCHPACGQVCDKISVTSWQGGRCGRGNGLWVGLRIDLICLILRI